MPFQSSMPEQLSNAEANALARFVRDLRIRMKNVARLLGERGTSRAASLAGSIEDDLSALEGELADSPRGAPVSRGGKSY